MTRPRLQPAITWEKLEQEVLAVFCEALRRLAQRASLPHGEEPINFELYWICRQVHHERMAARVSIPFFIDFDSTNQPEPDDSSDSRRLKKRPDFSCKLTNEQAATVQLSQVMYSLECKRLGQPEGNWILNENYSEHGMFRFIKANHGYAKGARSAAMIGYAQNTDPDLLLADVNSHATARKLPSLVRAAAAWATKDVTRLGSSLSREFAAEVLEVRHLWVDVRHCLFVRAPAKPPPVSSTKVKRGGKKSARKQPDA